VAIKGFFNPDAIGILQVRFILIHHHSLKNNLMSVFVSYAFIIK
jgi:hypothetical protein